MGRYVCIRPDYDHCEKNALKREVESLQTKVEELEGAATTKRDGIMMRICELEEDDPTWERAIIVNYDSVYNIVTDALLTGGEKDE